MYIKSISLMAIAACLTEVSAATAYVNNRCPFPIYLQSWPNGQNGANPGPTVQVPAGGRWNEPYRGTGSAIKLSNSQDFSKVLTFGYTPNQNDRNVYYDLSDSAGNPFSGYRNTLIPSVVSCPKFDCAPNAGGSCYSNGGSIKVRACAVTSDLTATTCA